MKKLTLLFILMVSMLAVVGCSNGEEETATTEVEIVDPATITEEVEVTFWYALSGDHEVALLEIVDAFNAEWEGTFHVTAQQQGTYADLAGKITNASENDTLPTMVLGYGDVMVPLIEKGQVVDLGPYIEDETVGMSNYGDINEAFAASGVFEGVTYGIPFNKSTEVLYVNETAMAEQGLEVPTNYDELVATSKAYYEATGMPGFGADSLSNYLISASYNNGTPYQTDGVVDLTSEGVTEIITDFQANIEAGYWRIAGEDEYLSGPFNSGQIPMYVGSTAGAAYVYSEEFEIGVYPVPYASSIEQGTNFYIFNTATPQEIAGAWEFVKFCLTDENVAAFSMATGYLPALDTVKESPEYQEFATTDAIAELYVNDQLVMFSDPAYYNSNTVRSTLDVLMSGVATDFETPVEDQIAAAQDEIDRTMER